MADTGAPARAADTKGPDSKVLDSKVLAEAAKRRTFAVISHPDAGKSTLTEALALHASAITQAGAFKLDASAKALKPQTLKLFDVCRSLSVPVITFVNKWDRPGREPLELLDEIEQRIGLRPAPVNWPVGVAGDFRGLIERTTGEYITFTRTPGGAGRALETRLDAEAAAARDGDAFVTAQEELALLDEIYGGLGDAEGRLDDLGME